MDSEGGREEFSSGERLRLQDSSPGIKWLDFPCGRGRSELTRASFRLELPCGRGGLEFPVGRVRLVFSSGRRTFRSWLDSFSTEEKKPSGREGLDFTCGPE